MTAPADLYTPTRVIKQALKDAGRLQTGQTPSADVYLDAQTRLVDLINFMQTQGLVLWLNSIQSVTLVAGTASYTLGPGGAISSTKPPRVLGGWYVASGGARRPLNPMAWSDYLSLGNLTSSGAVNSYFVDKQQSNLVVKFWQVPDATAATGTAELLVQRQATAWLELTDTIGFPVEWYMALRWSLADELSSGQPVVIMERNASKAAYFRAKLEDWDVEDAPTRFSPDSQMLAQGASRFR